MVSEEKIISIVSKSLDIPESNVTMNTKSSDLEEWDSLGHLSILSGIQDELGDKFNDNQEIASATSVKELHTIINA